jgi:uncharacterized protein
MARPIKCRRVDFFPGVGYFKPAGIPLGDLEEIQLSIEEIEAIRLKDLEGLEQEKGAERMNISRSTFQRVLTSARHKIADAILHGKAVRIEGGHYEIAPHRFRCANGHEWDLPFENGIVEPPQTCPTCSTMEITPLQSLRKWCGQPGSGRCCRKNKVL